MLILMIKLQRTSGSIQLGDDDRVAEDHEEGGEEKEKYIHQAVVHLVMMLVMILVMVVMVMVVMMMVKEEDNEENTNMYDVDLFSSVNPDRGSRTWITELSDQ